MSDWDPFLDPEEVAAEEGLVCVYPEENQLLLDLDHPKAEDHMRQMLELLDDFGITSTIESVTRSRGGNKHARVSINLAPAAGPRPPITPLERVLLQALLGSDLKREALSAITILANGQYPPTVLFEIPPEEDDGSETPDTPTLDIPIP
jgi:hypothetical protein